MFFWTVFFYVLRLCDGLSQKQPLIPLYPVLLNEARGMRQPRCYAGERQDEGLALKLALMFYQIHMEIRSSPQGFVLATVTIEFKC